LRISLLLRILAASCLSGMTAILVTTPPASAYEISLYAAYPIYFWAMLIGSYTCGVVLLVGRPLAEHDHGRALGLSIVVTTGVIVLLLPVFRGYAFYGRTDPSAEAGFVKQILLTGHISPPSPSWDKEDIYPATHILVAGMSYVTGLDYTLLSMLSPVGFFAFYEVSLFLLSRRICKNESEAALVTAFGAPLFSYYLAQFIPNISTFLLLPFILWLYIRGERKRIDWTIALLLPVLMLVLFHPFDALTYVLVFLCLLITGSVLKLHSSLAKRIRSRLGLGLLSVIGLTACSFAWISGFTTFRASFLDLEPHLSLTHTASLSQTSSITHTTFPLPQTAEPTQLTYELGYLKGVPVIEGIRIALILYGAALLLGLSSLVITLFALKGRLRSGNHQWAGLTFVPMFLIFAFLFPFGIAAIPALVERRTLPYLIFTSTIICGSGFYQWVSKREHVMQKRLATFAVVSILLGSILLGAFTVHPSPLVRAANEQVSYSEMEGMHWFVNYQAGLEMDNAQGIYPPPIAALGSGITTVPQNFGWGAIVLAPRHFGYDSNDHYPRKGRYLITNTLARIWNQNLTPDLPATWKYTKSDWVKLENDPAVQRVADNSGLQIYLVNGGSPPS